MSRNNVPVLIFLKVALTVLPNTGQLCKPEIVEGSHSKLDIDGNTSLECDISTCENVTLIKYEKNFKETSEEWMTVFEGVNDTFHHALDTGYDFTLENRNDYKVFRTHHILYIYPLILQDHGEWRCVVVQKNNMIAESKAIGLDFAITCQPKMIQGRHGKLEIDGHTFLECIISTCESVSKIVYQKTDVNEHANWTQVYEGISKTKHHALKTGTGYSLMGRSDYTAFLTQHILYIKPLSSNDHGEWRCVVYDKNGKSTESQAIYLDLAPTCTPAISLGSYDNPVIDGHASLECEIYTCANLLKIVYEKRGIYKRTAWKAVFEGIDNVNNHALPTKNYTLTKRNDYVAFHTKHMLYINPLILEDDGEWRCVVYETNNRSTYSQSIDLYIYVTPENNNIRIRSTDPAIVTNQSPKVVFTCEVDGIYPEPDVAWIVNGTDYPGGVPGNTQEEDGLWSVYNSLPMKFGKTGKVNVSCEMRIKQTTDRWLANMQIFDVKEAPSVRSPEESTKKIATAKSPFTLECKGSGYNRRISWVKDGKNIDENNANFIIKSNCAHKVHICQSTLSSQPFEHPATCEDIFEYTGNYNCIVKLQQPYDKLTDISPTMRIDVSAHIDTGLCRDVSIECHVCRQGTSQITWSFGDVQLGHEETHEIRDVSNKDFGIYTKTVSNMQGEFSCNTELHYDESLDTYCDWQIILIAIGVIIVLSGGIAATVVFILRMKKTAFPCCFRCLSNVLQPRTVREPIHPSCQPDTKDTTGAEKQSSLPMQQDDVTQETQVVHDPLLPKPSSRPGDKQETKRSSSVSEQLADQKCGSRTSVFSASNKTRLWSKRAKSCIETISSSNEEQQNEKLLKIWKSDELISGKGQHSWLNLSSGQGDKQVKNKTSFSNTACNENEQESADNTPTLLDETDNVVFGIDAEEPLG